jgi:DNA-binding transcriptional regulator YdaS (Cro superfamily)
MSFSSAALAGLQLKIARRLGVSPAPVASNGPVTTSVGTPPCVVNVALVRKSE